MKRLYQQIGLFFLPLVILLIGLPVDQQLKYAGLKDDCYNHAIWIYNRIFENEKPADIVFLGSSHTINGIDDKLIENQLRPTGLSVINLGYCRLGRNLHYVLLKELFKKKHPSLMIIEVRTDENRYSHPIFPYLASTSDVFLSEPFFNKDFFSDIFLHCAYKLQLSQDFLYGSTADNSNKLPDFGHATIADTVDEASLENYRKIHLSDSLKTTPTGQRFYMHYPHSYLKKIARLCKAHNIRLLFVYMPGFGAQSVPGEIYTYQKYGEVLIPPRKILDNKNFWYDVEHFNQDGATAFSKWLSLSLEPFLSKK